MALEQIISVSGKPGLYKILSQTNYGLVAESLEDGKKVPVYSNYRISALVEISMYTYGEDVPLAEILWSIYEKEGKKEVSTKMSDAEVRAWFETILPDYDKERVYTSDIKKLVKWYNLLLKNNLITKPEAEGAAEEVVEEKPKAKKTTKKAAEATEEAAVEKPKAKKTTAKKTTTAGEKAAKSTAAPKSAGKTASKVKGAGKVSTPRKAS